MTKVTFHYGAKVVEKNWIEIRNPDWNQKVLRPLCEPVRPDKVYCHCGQIPVEMHTHQVRNKLHHYYLGNNPNSPIMHSPNCTKGNAKVLDGAAEARPKHCSGVTEEVRGGKVYLSINIELFKSEGVGSEQTKFEGNPKAGESVRVTTSNVRNGSVTNTVEFGGLIREWYLLGLDIATKKTIGELLFSMWRRVLLDDRITIKNDVPLKKVAIIPAEKFDLKRLSEGEQKVVLGYVFNNPVEIEKGLYSVTVRGVRAEWDVYVPKRLMREFGLKSRLCAFRVKVEKGMLVSTNFVFGALVHDVGAVWLDSKNEVKAYEELLRQKFRVDKPLTITDEWYGFRPDFVILGTAVPTIVEVWGMPDEKFDEYHRQKLKKLEQYRWAEREGHLHLIEWDATKPGEFPKFAEQLSQLRAKQVRYKS